MTRFFFHLHHPYIEIRDEVGLELADLRDAEREAKNSICELVADNLKVGIKFSLLGIRISDTDDNTISVVLSREILRRSISHEVLAIDGSQFATGDTEIRRALPFPAGT